MNLIYQHHSLSNNNKSTTVSSGGLSSHQQSALLQKFKRPSQDSTFASHLSHNSGNNSNSKPLSSFQHQTTSMLVQKPHVASVPPSNSFSCVISPQQQQLQHQSQHSMNQAIDIDINELFKG